MAAGTIIRAWSDGINAYLAVGVTEGGIIGVVEYVGSVSLSDDLKSVGFPGQTWGQLTTANKKAALVTATKAVRDVQRALPTDLGLSGGVTI